MKTVCSHTSQAYAPLPLADSRPGRVPQLGGLRRLFASPCTAVVFSHYLYYLLPLSAVTYRNNDISWLSSCQHQFNSLLGAIRSQKVCRGYRVQRCTTWVSRLASLSFPQSVVMVLPDDVQDTATDRNADQCMLERYDDDDD